MLILMNKNHNYHIELSKLVTGGVRNIDSYYIILTDSSRSVKWISKSMRNDEDNDDTIVGDGSIIPTYL